MSQTDIPRKIGLLGSITALSKTLVSMVHTRLHLLAIDLEEDRIYLLQMIKLILLMMFCMAMGVILLTMLVTVLFWDTHREVVLAILASGFFLMSFTLWRYAVMKAKQKPMIFSSSLAELLKDGQSLEMHSQESNE